MGCTQVALCDHWLLVPCWAAEIAGVAVYLPSGDCPVALCVAAPGGAHASHWYDIGVAGDCGHSAQGVCEPITVWMPHRDAQAVS